MTINANKDSPVFSQEAFNYLLEWTSQLTSHYSETGETPEKGWEKAHHPVPKRLKGTDIVWMKREHHAIHGVLQSEAFGVGCTSGLYSKLLANTEFAELQEKWVSAHAKEATNGWSEAALRSSIASIIKKYGKQTEVTHVKSGKTEVFESLHAAARALGEWPGTLRKVILGERNEVRGYTAQYL